MDPYSLVRIMSDGINRGYHVFRFSTATSISTGIFNIPAITSQSFLMILSREEKSKNPYPRVVVAVVFMLNSVTGNCLLVSMFFVLIFAFASTGFD